MKAEVENVQYDKFMLTRMTTLWGGVNRFGSRYLVRESNGLACINIRDKMNGYVAS